MNRLRVYSLMSIVINTFLAIVSGFLLFRVLFLAFSINQSTPVVRWIMQVSSFLMTPFAGIVPNLAVQSGVVDFVALISLVIYLIAGYILMSILSGLVEPESAEGESEAIAHYHEVKPHRHKYIK